MYVINNKLFKYESNNTRNLIIQQELREKYKS